MRTDGIGDARAAAAVFARFGADPAALEGAGLKAAWIRLARRYHPLGGAEPDEAVMAEINAAYDTLRRHRAARGGAAPQAEDPQRHGVSVWAWAGHSPGDPPPSDHIAREDYGDANFIRRRLWELSGGSEEEWTIWPFDGQRFMTPLTVYGSSAVFDEMARAALRFARRGFRMARAVFVQRRGERWGRLLLIYADGTFHDGLAFDHQGGAHPGHDPFLLDRLPSVLDQLRAGPASRAA
ncbi:J domain-containing protein [Caldovatus aquaticus]|uniref:J domain-containing protein n=1 Tax=Caldovatus aquaticus TaxID=2865671 RepID=A0ABS7F6G4_9PROT|nr:J domain-containing protein [Caldovatus aquaticus]MBW8270385.1 J domain-containing protein [Caldovatus aquaticus]